MEDLEVIIIIAAIINVIIIYLVISRLGNIVKQQKKTNFLIYKKMTKDGYNFSDDEMKFLNN